MLVMDSCDDNDKLKGRPVLPGLLFWQKLVPSFALGILSIKWLLPSFAAFFIYLFILAVSRVQKGTFVLLVLLFGLGSWYGAYSLPPQPGPIPQWMSLRQKVDLTGQIQSIKTAPGGRLKVLLKDVVCNSTAGLMQLNGYLKWTWDQPDIIPLIGQKVSLNVRVKPVHGFRNSGVWDYDFYCRTQNIYYRTYTRGPIKNGGLKSYRPDFLQKLRISLRTHIQQNAPPTQGGAVFSALLTGNKFYLSRTTTELIRRAGVSHVLALSGLHVGFIVSIGFVFAWLIGGVVPNVYLKIPRLKLGVLFSAPTVLFYLWLGDFTPSLLRATCMFGFWGILLLMNRGRVLLDGLFLAIVLILSFAPLSIFDLGFQLSVLAVAGIALFYPLFQCLLPKGGDFFIKLTRFVLALLFVSLCANIVLLPMLVWNFGVLTPNLLFNLLFVPLLGLFIMPVCGIGGLALSYISPYLSQKLFASGAYLFEQLLGLVNWAAESCFLPEYAFYRPLWEDLLVYYLLLVLILLLANGNKRMLKFLSLPILLLLCLRIYGEFGPARVKVDVLDTGQSQCVVISGPLGSRTVVDGGGGFGNTFDMGRSIVGPWLCNGNLPRVDHIFMTHGDRDHAGGLAFLLEKFKIGNFYTNGDLPKGKTGERFVKAFVQNEITERILRSGSKVELESGLVMEVLHPAVGFEGSRNDSSLYLRLLWKGRPLMSISGDLDHKGIRALLKSGRDLNSEVLILPHHGSSGSFSPELYEKVNPKITLAACGFLNRFNFVAKKVRSQLAKMKIQLYTTSQNGMISISWTENDKFHVSP